jgi:hypothetical protein
MCVCLTRESKASPGCIMPIVLRFRDWHRLDFIKGVRWNGGADRATRRQARVSAWKTVESWGVEQRGCPNIIIPGRV